jgi:hypothetical protein
MRTCAGFSSDCLLEIADGGGVPGNIGFTSRLVFGSPNVFVIDPSNTQSLFAATAGSAAGDV